jgi:hypothetical protein
MITIKQHKQLLALAFSASLFFCNGFLNAALEEMESASIFNLYKQEKLYNLQNAKKEYAKNRLREQILKEVTESDTQLKDLLQDDASQVKKSNEHLLKKIAKCKSEDTDKVTTPEMIQKSSVSTPASLGKVALFYNKQGFYVVKDGKVHQVKNHLLDRSLRNISKDSAKLKEFFKNGYICVNQDENGDYLLIARDRVKGGGLIIGAVFYWVVKSVCYGVGAAIVGKIASKASKNKEAAAVAGTVAAGVITTAAENSAPPLVTNAVGRALGGVTSVGSAAVAAAIEGGGHTEAVGMVATAVVTSDPVSRVGIQAAIEWAAEGARSLGNMIPAPYGL